MATFTADEVVEWDTDSVAGWLDLNNHRDCIDVFRENDINGAVLIDLDEDLLEEMGIAPETSAALLSLVEDIKSAAPSASKSSEEQWEDEDDSEPDDEDATFSTGVDESSVAGAAPAHAAPIPGGSKRLPKTNKKKDPLRIAAKSRAVADLERSTVTSGYLWKVGGSGIKMKHWNKRFFVLTDDNCLYYFKSPKDMSALGLIMLPSYTITVCDKSENVGSKQFTWKAVNRVHEADRKYVFAAETLEDMKTWMNVMSLASIAFGSGKASMAKDTGSRRLAADAELDTMKERASERSGGVTGGDEPIAAVVTNSEQKVPAHLAKTIAMGKKSGRTLCLIKMLDGDTLQLYAEANTTGTDFLNQVCIMLSAYEKYYFGLSYTDRKGDQQWIEMDKKVIKHDFKKGTEHLELEFLIRFHPMDVTQVMQYVTLYQAFLAARRQVVKQEIVTTGKDSMLLAALSLQAVRGDYNPAVHSAASINPHDLVPAKTMREARIPNGISPTKLMDFWREELIRCWVKMSGILKHLAVLKYMQIIQKHRLYGMSFAEVKNKKGTPLTLGVSPHGLFVYRQGHNDFPVVKFSWAECSELSFTEKKFTIQVHDRNTKAFSVYCARAKIAQRILRLCVGLHQLYVQTMRKWSNPPADLAVMRKEAIQAALKEREDLQKESVAARERARLSAGAPAPKAQAAAPTAAAPAPSGGSQAKGDGAVVVAGRDKAVEMIDMMMNDQDFMQFQEQLMVQMEEELGDGYDDIGEDIPDQMPTTRERCNSELIVDRVKYMESLGH